MDIFVPSFILVFQAARPGRVVHVIKDAFHGYLWFTTYKMRPKSPSGS